MKIQKKIFLVIGVTMLASFILLTLILSTIFMDSFISLEKQDVEENVQQAINTINREVYSQTKINSDWAEWDDTYQFVKDRNEGYIKSNFDGSTFMRLKLNGVLFADTEGQVVFSSGYDILNDRQEPVSKSLAGNILELHDRGLSNVSGLTTIDDKITLITVHPILKSDGSGPQGGMLVMMRYLDESQIKELSQITGLKMDLLPMDSALLAELSANPGGKMETVIVKPVNSTAVQGYGIMDDIYGQPLFVVRIEVERGIYQQGLNTILYLVSALIACAATFSIILSLIIDRFFLKRLILLNKEIDLAAKDETSLARIYLPGKDELSDLAVKIDGNIGLLRQNLVEKRDIISKQEKTQEELRKSAEELKAKTEGLEKLNSLSVGRELRMVEMKKRIWELEKNKKTEEDDTK